MATKIVVDAGHGGSNPGAIYQGRRESDDVLRLAMAVGRILEENGYDVSYTRTSDITQSVGQKAAIANEEGADLFISLHRNAAQYPGQYTGVQTLIYDNSGFKREMAENINRNLEALGFRNAGVDVRPNLVVLNSTQMPALLVEAGFIDSDVDNQLFDSRFQAMAQGIADGIMETLENLPVMSSNLSEVEDDMDDLRRGPMPGIPGNNMPSMPGDPMQPQRPMPGDPMQPQRSMPGGPMEQMPPMQGMPQRPMPGGPMQPQRPMPGGPMQPQRPMPDMPMRPSQPGRPQPPFMPELPMEPEETLYRVQAGAFRERQSAENLLQLLENDDFPAYIVYQDGLYKVQIGAFSRLSNAIAMEREVRQKGYNTYITT